MNELWVANFFSLYHWKLRTFVWQPSSRIKKFIKQFKNGKPNENNKKCLWKTFQFLLRIRKFHGSLFPLIPKAGSMLSERQEIMLTPAMSNKFLQKSKKYGVLHLDWESKTVTLIIKFQLFYTNPIVSFQATVGLLGSHPISFAWYIFLSQLW